MKYKQYEPEVLHRVQASTLEVATEIFRICEKYNIRCFGVFGTVLGAVRHTGFIPWDDDMDVGMLREDFERFLKVAPEEIKGRFKLTGPECENKYYNLVHNLSMEGTRFATIFDHGNYNVGIPCDIFVFDYTYDDPKLRLRQERRCRFWRMLYLLRNVNFAQSHIEGSGSPLHFAASYIAHYSMKLLGISPDWIYRQFRKEATKVNSVKSNNVTCFDDLDTERDRFTLSMLFPLTKLPFENLQIPVPNDYHGWLTQQYHDYMTLPKEEDRWNHYPYILDFGDHYERV